MQKNTEIANTLYQGKHMSSVVSMFTNISSNKNIRRISKGNVQGRVQVMRKGQGRGAQGEIRWGT